MSNQARLFDPASADEVRSQFERCRYVAVQGLLQSGLTSMLYRHIQARLETGALRLATAEGLERSFEISSDPMMENLLRGLTPLVESLAGKQLFATYSFVRVYRTGDKLAVHRDRAACEVSLSLNLGQDCEQPWPLWVKGPCGSRAAALAPGDGLLYRGHECEHWREPFLGKEYTQVFLHYVEQDGAHAALKFDGREHLGFGAWGPPPESN